MELLAKLGIDWRLFLAQIVNFTILLSILSLAVYRPLLRLIDERRERIRKSMDDAEKIARHKEDLNIMRQKALREIDQECGALLEKARQEAERAKTEILEEAKKEAQNILAKGRDQLRHERAEALQGIQKTLAMGIVRVTETIIKKEFSDHDQERILTEIVRSLPPLLP